MTGVGAQPYGGLVPSNETAIFKALPASIQEDRQRGTTESKTPTAAPGRSGWRVLIPRAAAAKGTIQERDVVVDDLGKRYVVIAAYWNVLGYNLVVELLQA